MPSQIFNVARGTLYATAAAATLAAGSAAAEQRSTTLDNYCTMQQSGNPAVVHQNYHPFTDPNVTVTLDSSHGSITMPFSCASTIVVCERRGAEWGGKFAFTGDTIAIAHAGLGSYNATDSASARRTMARLSGSFDVLERANPNALAGEQHLEDAHGMDIINVNSRGEIERAPNGDRIIQACIPRLNR